MLSSAVVNSVLTFTTLLANSADNKLVIFFLFFPENRFWYFIKIVSIGEFAQNIKNCFLGKIRKIFQTVVCWNFYPEC